MLPALNSLQILLRKPPLEIHSPSEFIVLAHTLGCRASHRKRRGAGGEFYVKSILQSHGVLVERRIYYDPVVPRSE